MALRYSDGQGDPVTVLEAISVDTAEIAALSGLSYSKLSYCERMGINNDGSVSFIGRFIIAATEPDADELAKWLNDRVGHLVLVGRPTVNSDKDKQFICLGVITYVDMNATVSYRAQVNIQGMFAQEGYPLFLTGNGDYLPRDLTVIDLTPFSSSSGVGNKTLVTSVRTGA